MKIRLGTEKDLSQIIDIQNYWLEQQAESSKGFLFGEPYTYEDLAELTLRKQIAVAVKNNMICGYFLFDNYSRNHTTYRYKMYLTNLISNGYIDYSLENLCPRAQIAVHKSFLGHNLSRKLTKYLFDKSGYKFEAIFSTVSKKNLNLETHLKNGWNVIGENDELHFVLLRIKN